MRNKACFLFLFNLFLASVSAFGQPDLDLKLAQKKVSEYQGKMKEHEVSDPALAFAFADSLEMLGEDLSEPSFLYAAYKKKGDIKWRQGELPEALSWLKMALELSQDLRDTLSIVRAYNNLGAVYFNSGIFDKALKSFSQANLLGGKVLSKPQKSSVIINIGLVYYELGQYAEALNQYSDALEINKEEPDTLSLAFIYNNLGRLYYRQGEGEKALAHYRLARKLNEKIENEIGLAESLMGISMVYLKDNPEISLEYLRLAKKLYLKNKSKSGLLMLNRQAGETYLEQENYDHALIHFNLAQDYADSLGNLFQESQILLNIAGLQEKKGDFESAASYYRQYVAKEKEASNQELVENIAYTRADYELGRKENEIKDLEQQAAYTSSQLQWRNMGLLFAGLLSLLTIAFGLVSAFKYKSSKRANTLLKTRNDLVHKQKAEIEQQHLQIQRKKEELEEARQQKEAYNAELLAIKEKLEEKVKDRTRELEEIYIKLSFHIHNTPLAVLEWNSRRELVHWPKQAEAIFGYTAEEMLGLRIEEVPFVLPDDRQEVIHTIEELSRGEVARHYSTHQHINRDGKICFVEWIFSVQLNKEGNLESVLTIANDVTLREQTYRELKSANQELDTFLYKSSHDLRGPIARMQGIINLGLLETEDPNARMYFNMLNKVTDELNNLLLRLLMVHNINQHDFAQEEIEFRSFVDSLIANYAGRRRSEQVVEIVNSIPESMQVYSDPTLLNIVLVNLLENGLMFADNFNPRIEFDAIYLPSGKYILLVSDNGMGIPDQFREKIFDMFFQGSTRSTGTGLGLYMVRKATKKMGGDIRLTSENGQTVFEITLPASKAQPNQKVEVIN